MLSIIGRTAWLPKPLQLRQANTALAGTFPGASGVIDDADGRNAGRGRGEGRGGGKGTEGVGWGMKVEQEEQEGEL